MRAPPLTSATECPPAGLTMQLFGPLVVRRHGCPLPGLCFRKSQWLLALFVLGHGRPVKREWLNGRLWPDDTDRQALRNSLTNLRQALGAEAARIHAPSRQTLAFDLSGVTVDLFAFEAALDRGDAEALELAVALYRGPLLEGCGEEWLFEERERRAQAYLAAREKLAALALERGQITLAEEHLRLAVAADPLRESAQRALMQVRAAGGSDAAALPGYSELRERLHRELNGEPDVETQSPFQQLGSEARGKASARRRPSVHDTNETISRGLSPILPPLSLRLFGPFEALLEGAPILGLRRRNGRWVLALLALRAGREVERAWVASLLWPDTTEPGALKNLRSSLSEVRRALGPAGVRLRSPTSSTLCLELTYLEADIVAFDAAISAGDEASLMRAVALYRGPLLEGCAEAWAFQDREVRERAYLESLETLAAHALARGETVAAERHLRRAVSADPLLESAQRALMQTLVVKGNYAEAILAYRELRLKLHQEINAEPDTATTALFQQFLREARHR